MIKPYIVALSAISQAEKTDVVQNEDGQKQTSMPEVTVETEAVKQGFVARIKSLYEQLIKGETSQKANQGFEIFGQHFDDPTQLPTL